MLSLADIFYSSFVTGFSLCDYFLFFFIFSDAFSKFTETLLTVSPIKSVRSIFLTPFSSIILFSLKKELFEE
jgi:hypothetical protein